MSGVEYPRASAAGATPQRSGPNGWQYSKTVKESLKFSKDLAPLSADVMQRPTMDVMVRTEEVKLYVACARAHTGNLVRVHEYVKHLKVCANTIEYHGGSVTESPPLVHETAGVQAKNQTLVTTPDGVTDEQRKVNNENDVVGGIDGAADVKNTVVSGTGHTAKNDGENYVFVDDDFADSVHDLPPLYAAATHDVVAASQGAHEPQQVRAPRAREQLPARRIMALSR